MKQVGRRRFLYCVGGVGVFAGLTTAVPIPPMATRQRTGRSEDGRPIVNLQSVTRDALALGSNVSITVMHASKAQAQRAVDAAFSELQLVEQLMSIYQQNSQLTRLNRDRILHDPHPYVLEVLQFARHMSESTSGAFDITIQPLWELFSDAYAAGMLPNYTDVMAARKLVDWRRVETNRNFVRLHGEGMKVTLNGIAQGFAADRVAQALRNHGIEIAMIDTGEIGVLGTKPQSDGWKIGIQHPREQDCYVSLAKLDGRCLATSGDYATSFSSDHRHHHLFNPMTGYSPTELSSVSIVAGSAVMADALSTAVFVMGLKDGTALIQRTADVEAMFITKDARRMVTGGFPIA